MKYTTYLFDFDYTLADSSRGIVICFRNVLERHGHMGITDEAIKRTIGKTLEDSFSILSGITDTQTLADYRKEYVKEADTHMTVNTVFFPETVSVLTELKEQGVKIGIISTKYRYRIREMLDPHFPKNFFDIIIGGEDVKKHKPHPQGIRKALRRLHRRKSETLYIGDSTVDAETAQRAKVDFVGVLNGMTTREELAAYPHRQILDNLSLLPRVDKFTPYKPNKYLPEKVISWYRLLHQKQIRGKHEIKETKAPCTCKNCGRPYHGNHCPHCGQSRNTPRFTIRNAFQNVLSGFFNIDNGFSRNLLELLYRPGYMIRDYMKGKRIHYYKPFQTLFVLAAIYIMAVQLIDPESMEKLKKEEKQDVTLSELRDDIRLHEDMAKDDSVRYYLGQSATYVDSARIALENPSPKKTPRPIGYELDAETRTKIKEELNAEIKEEIKQKSQKDVKNLSNWKKLIREVRDSLDRKDDIRIAAAGGKASKQDTIRKKMRKEILANMAPEVNYDYDDDSDIVDDLVEAGQLLREPFDKAIGHYFTENGFITAVTNLMKSWVHGNKAFSILALLPLLTLGTRWSFRRTPIGRRLNLTENFFAQVYIACQILWISLLILPFTGQAHLDDIFDLSYEAIFLLFVWDYRQLFGLTWKQSFWRTIIMCWYCLLVLVIICSIIISILIIAAYAIQWSK